MAGTARRPCGRLPRGAVVLRGVVAFYSLSCGRPYPGVPVMNDDASKWSPRPPPLGLLAVGTLYLHSKDQDHLPVPQDQSHEPLQPPRHRAAWKGAQTETGGRGSVLAEQALGQVGIFMRNLYNPNPRNSPYLEKHSNLF